GGRLGPGSRRTRTTGPRTDLHPATLPGCAPRGPDAPPRPHSVPAVAARRRAADHGQEVFRLLDVHVVQLAGGGVHLPARGARVVDAHLVLHPAPLDHARLTHQLEVTVHVPREQVHVNVADRAGGEPHGEVGDVVGADLEAGDAIDDGAHLDDLSEEPAHVVDRVALVEQAPPALLGIGHVELAIVLAGVTVEAGI